MRQSYPFSTQGTMNVEMPERYFGASGIKCLVFESNLTAGAAP